MQEVGQPGAPQDLSDAIDDGTWHTATADPDGRGFRVGFLSRLELLDTTQVAAFPDGLRAIQVDDTTTTITAMGRPALSAFGCRPAPTCGWSPATSNRNW